MQALRLRTTNADHEKSLNQLIRQSYIYLRYALQSLPIFKLIMKIKA